jgi:hypothetical protein
MSTPTAVPFTPRHAVDITGRLGPAHTVVISGCTIASPGTNVFLQPTSGIAVALDWHAGTYRTKVIGCHVQGSVTIRGHAMEILHCTLENGGSQANQGMIDCFEFGPALDFRLIGCKLFLRKEHSGGSGMLFNCINRDWNPDAGAIGSIAISDNDIYVMLDSTQPLIGIENGDAKDPATGVIHITGNRVAHCASSSSQPFVDIDVADGLECVVANNIMPGNVTFGSAGIFTRQVLSPNVIGGRTTYVDLPTSDPGGSGRLWSDGGTLKIT